MFYGFLLFTLFFCVWINRILARDKEREKEEKDRKRIIKYINKSKKI